MEPLRALLDEHGHINALVCAMKRQDSEGQWLSTGKEQAIPVRTVLTSTGTRPNIAYEYEHPGTFERDDLNYRTFVEEDGSLVPVPATGDPSQKCQPHCAF